MQEVWKPETIQKIDQFMSRKAREFPELELTRKWYDREILPKKRSHGETLRLSIKH